VKESDRIHFQIKIKIGIEIDNTNNERHVIATRTNLLRSLILIKISSTSNSLMFKPKFTLVNTATEMEAMELRMFDCRPD
jgi:hypothetical protein